MDGKGWKPDYGISAEGVRLLGFLEAIPREERAKVAAEVEKFCRAQGYVSLHDDLRALFGEAAEEQPGMGKVLPFRRGRG